jgi:predicted aspartyl protease
MTAESEVRHTKGSERQMGHVYANIRITNDKDRVLAEAGVIPESEIRSIELHDVLVDTGATHLVLPRGLIQQLGLDATHNVRVMTADGPRESRMFGHAHLMVDGRDDVFSCIEVPDDASPLLGVVPLEVLGLEPDLVNRELRVLPREGPNSHILLY